MKRVILTSSDLWDRHIIEDRVEIRVRKICKDMNNPHRFRTWYRYNGKCKNIITKNEVDVLA